MKPQILESVLEEIRPARRPGMVFLSIAAGFPTSRIEAVLGASVPVVRAMPNVAAVVRSSATVLCAGRHATAEHLADARRIFESIGLELELPEYQGDAVTGLSGSGPMYVFQHIQGLSDAGVRVGLSRDVSTALTIQTVLGAARMAGELKTHPGILKNSVTSPGGTAIAALHSLERNRLRAILMDAVEVATARSKVLKRPPPRQLPRRPGRDPPGDAEGDQALFVVNGSPVPDSEHTDSFSFILDGADDAVVADSMSPQAGLFTALSAFPNRRGSSSPARRSRPSRKIRRWI